MLRLFKQYYPVRNAVFVVGEFIYIFFSVMIASWLIIGMSFHLNSLPIISKTILVALVCQLCLYYNDLYRLSTDDRLSDMFFRLLQSLGAAAIILAMIYFVFPKCIIARNVFIVSVGIIITFIVTWRVGYAQVLNRGFFNQNIALLGSGDLAKNIFSEINMNIDCGYQIRALDDRNALWKHSTLANNPDVYPIAHKDLVSLARDLKIKKIVVGIEERRNCFPTKQLLECRIDGIEVLEGTTFYEMLTGKLIVDNINPSWLIFSDGFQKSIIRRLFKRSVDLSLALLMIALLSPVLLVVAVLIKLDSEGPVLFTQERVGENRKPYMVYKFRSMVEDAEKVSGPVWAQSDDPRITRVGRFIRKWRIDEFPQIFNVIKGEMSFVGPRPERGFFVDSLKDQIPFYTERFTVKPGITGWAQVNYPYGDSVADAKEKLNYDLFYIKNMSIFMDLMVIMRTVKTVLFGEGAR